MEHKLLRETYQNVRESFVDGLPKHRLPSAQDIELTKGCSSIFVVEWSKFKTMSTLEIQRVFSQRHILVLNAPVETVNFDREGLGTIGSLTTTCEVQGKRFSVLTINMTSLTLIMQWRNSVPQVKTLAK
jgi:hypothetical protein